MSPTSQSERCRRKRGHSELGNGDNGWENARMCDKEETPQTNWTKKKTANKVDKGPCQGQQIKSRQEQGHSNGMMKVKVMTEMI